MIVLGPAAPAVAYSEFPVDVDPIWIVVAMFVVAVGLGLAVRRTIDVRPWFVWVARGAAVAMFVFVLTELR